jgi:hypothetical protein
MRLVPTSDQWSSTPPAKLTGSKWLDSFATEWQRASKSTWTHGSLDMSMVDRATLFEWTVAVAMVENLLLKLHTGASFGIDLIGSRDLELLPPNIYLHYRQAPSVIPPYHLNAFALSNRVYTLAGFLESLGTLDILNRSDRPGIQVFYPGMNKVMADLRKFFGGRSSHTVILGLTRIDTKEDCKQFLDERRILSWRSAMQERFSGSSLLESEELWRVICHELAVNIWEHSGSTGMISARIVEDIFGPRKDWWDITYLPPFGPLPPHLGNGFLEICIADAGIGFIKTLRSAYLQTSGLRKGTHVPPTDILAFAFDEIGTCKSMSESWITERHALGRILLLAAKYGGIVRLKSGAAEVIYKPCDGSLIRQPNNLGYTPQHSALGTFIPGAQIQLLLPLIPKIAPSQSHQVSRLLTGLPQGFRLHPDHAIGQLIPVLERVDQRDVCIGTEARQRFKQKCETLARDILDRRPRSEPLILDFSELNWPAAQFETFLHLLQNVLQTRPVLLLELHPDLAHDVAALERECAPTRLDPDLISPAAKGAIRRFDELPEKRFLETYNRIHATVLAVDRNGRKYIFGVPGGGYQEALLRLVEGEDASIDGLCAAYPTLKGSILRAILTSANQLFRQRNNLWGTLWDEHTIDNAYSRVTSKSFDKLAEQSGAWAAHSLARREPQRFKDKPPIFYLPWLAEWREDFLESARILSQSHFADDIAQRLLYRLQKHLHSRGKSLDDVKVLASVTTPSLLLASALHRWWPTIARPAVADLGYYVLMGKIKNFPAITSSGGIVIVQDILDTKRNSNNLVSMLREQGQEVLCVLAFIKLETDRTITEVTPIDEKWFQGPDDAVSSHAMIKIARPRRCAAPKSDEDYTQAFWVEPRLLRAISYSLLRRDFPYGRDHSLERRSEYLQKFDSLNLLTAGHYVYGKRHYPVTVDVRGALTKEIGTEIAHWLADVCEGKKGTRAQWETEEGFALQGDVSTVLMPLHSNVHYIWPKVENALAQRGRWQPNWWLEASLFIGTGPTYSMPPHVQYQIEQAVEEAADSRQRPEECIKHPLRILIVDDAIATAQTAETILTTIIRHLEVEFRKRKKRPEDCPRPIEWVRYFAVLNQMSNTPHSFWHNLSAVGKMKIPIVFEEFAPFMGVPVYDEESCPQCRDRGRIERLLRHCEQHNAEETRQWAERRHHELAPIAIDSPEYARNTNVALPRAITVLPSRRRAHFQTFHADTAIWRFHELMYLSCPPSDILGSLDQAQAQPGDSEAVSREYERYRWAVFEWCAHNWARLEANAAKPQFIECAQKEITAGSRLVPKLLEICTLNHADSQIMTFVGSLIDELVKAEMGRQSHETQSKQRITKTTMINIALAAFCMGVPRAELTRPFYGQMSLVDYMNVKARELDLHGHSLLRNLYRQLTRHAGYADPQWALETVAEAIFRGRSRHQATAGSHKLLPKLLDIVIRTSGGNPEDRALLRGSLASFLAALEDLELHFELDESASADIVKEYSRKVLEWLKYPAKSKEGQTRPREVVGLYDQLLPSSNFMASLREMFHREVSELIQGLHTYVATKAHDRLQLTIDSADTDQCSLLGPFHELYICLTNLAVDPVDKMEGEHKSLLQIRLLKDESRIRFRLLTSFADPHETHDKLIGSRSANAERHILTKFGAVFDDTWTTPTASERESGYKAVYELTFMAGYIPKETRR